MKLFEFLKTRCLVWIWNHTPNCADMSRLASRSLEQPLPLRTRLRMRLHYLICVWCQRYLRQLKFLRSAAHEHPDELAEPVSQKLSDEARERIKRKLQTKAK